MRWTDILFAKLCIGFENKTKNSPAQQQTSAWQESSLTVPVNQAYTGLRRELSHYVRLQSVTATNSNHAGKYNPISLYSQGPWFEVTSSSIDPPCLSPPPELTSQGYSTKTWHTPATHHKVFSIVSGCTYFAPVKFPFVGRMDFWLWGNLSSHWCSSPLGVKFRTEGPPGSTSGSE